MEGKLIAKFMALAGQNIASELRTGSESERKLGAQLLLSEVLEYVIHGLGIIPVVNGTEIHKPDSLDYHIGAEGADRLEMIDGLADVAYTMYWNANAFGVPLEQAFDLVCHNNLDKFVRLADWSRGELSLEKSDWALSQGVCWPAEVVPVTVVRVNGEYYAVGKDSRGKVRKPSSYKPVDLTGLLST